jgi:hypothetical protein
MPTTIPTVARDKRGLKGAHIQRARDSKGLFKPIAQAIENALN